MQHSINANELATLSFEAAFYVLLLPFIFLAAGEYIEVKYLIINIPSWIKLLVAFISMPIGLVLLPWSLFSLFRIKHRAARSNPLSPVLSIFGPYKYCRSPICLGAMFYYLGIGALFGSIISGIIGFMFMLIFGSLFVKFVTEPSFEKRFKTDYAKYKSKTPFLIPKIG